MPSTDTITSTDLLFATPGLTVTSAKWNAHAAIYRGHLLPVDGSVSAAANNVYDLGSSTYKWRNVNATQLIESSSPNYQAKNISLDSTIGSSEITFHFKTKTGNTPSSTDPIEIDFRSATSATGTNSKVQGTASITTTISSGSTAGFVSGSTHYLYIYALNNAGTIEAAWSQAFFDDGSIVSTTAEGGAGAADSNATMYSTTARSNVACRLLYRCKFSLTTAGTWDEKPDEITAWPFQRRKLLCVYRNSSSTVDNTERKITYSTKSEDYYNAYSSGTFTAPYAMTVFVAAVLSASATWNASDQWNMFIRRAGSTLYEVITRMNSNSGLQSRDIYGVIDLAKGETMEIYAQIEGTSASIFSSTTINYLIISEVDYDL